MDLTHALRELWRLRLGVIAVVWVAVVVALCVSFNVSLSPPSLESKSYEFGAASTVVMVDGKRSPVVDIRQQFEPLATRAAVYARLMTSAPVREYIAREIGLPGAAIVAEGPPSPNVTRAEREPLAGERSNALLGENVGYRLSFRSEDELPILNIAAQAPTAADAVKLADAAVVGLTKYVARVQRRSDVKPGARVRLSQLGAPQGGIVNSGVNKTVPVLAFGATLIIGLALLLAAANVVRNWRASAVPSRPSAVEPVPPDGHQAAVDDPLVLHGTPRTKTAAHGRT